MTVLTPEQQGEIRARCEKAPKLLGMVVLLGCRCRCGHEWLPRNRDVNGGFPRPASCPSCKSALWDREKQASRRPRMLPDGRMTARNAALYLGLSEKTLAQYRSSRGGGPPFMKRGRIFYFKADLDAWIRAARVGSTREYKVLTQPGAGTTEDEHG